MKQLYFTMLAFLIAFTSQAQITGTFTVGTPTSDYTTLTNAAADLQTQGVASGGVILNMAPGAYDERVIFENINGLSQTAPLVIQATPGTVMFAATGTTSTSDATMRFNSLSWVTIDGINFSDIGTAATEIEYAIRFLGSATAGCSNNTIRNCAITMGAGGNRPGTRTRGIIFNSSGTTPETSNSNNTIDNVSIDNSSWGIQMSASADFFGRLRQVDVNNQIINSTFGAQLPLGHDFSSSAIAINVLGGGGLKIDNNTIASIQNLNSTPTTLASTSGISLDSCSGEITNNTISQLYMKAR